MAENENFYDIIDGEALEEVRTTMPDDGIVMRLSEFYKVMSDSTRLKILLALEKHELCVSDLASLFSMTRSAVSHQLKSLKTAKLVKSRKDGKSVYYSLDDDHIHSVIKVAFAHVLEEHDECAH